ncbi:hypothetical protein AOLI_G00269750 [Acnodon oligacanthus]
MGRAKKRKITSLSYTFQTLLSTSSPLRRPAKASPLADFSNLERFQRAPLVLCLDEVSRQQATHVFPPSPHPLDTRVAKATSQHGHGLKAFSAGRSNGQRRDANTIL